MEWHQKNPKRWGTEQHFARQVLDAFTSGIDERGIAFVEGVFHIKSEHGHIFDSVTLKIEYPRSFPNRNVPPKVIVLSHRDRWQTGADAHIYSDWSLCLFVPGDSRIDFNKYGSLNALFGVLRTFLFKEWRYQKDISREQLTKKKAVWPGEARSHGGAGIVEAVREIGKIGRNDPCPCGSGKKFKACCIRVIYE